MTLDNLQQFIESLQYSKMKRLKSYIALIRNFIGEYQDKQGLRRMEWTDLGIVGIFSKINIYEKYNNDLFEYLDNHGVIPIVLLKIRPILEERFHITKRSYACSNYP